MGKILNEARGEVENALQHVNFMLSMERCFSKRRLYLQMLRKAR